MYVCASLSQVQGGWAIQTIQQGEYPKITVSNLISSKSVRRLQALLMAHEFLMDRDGNGIQVHLNRWWISVHDFSGGNLWHTLPSLFGSTHCLFTCGNEWFQAYWWWRWKCLFGSMCLGKGVCSCRSWVWASWGTITGDIWGLQDSMLRLVMHCMHWVSCPLMLTKMCG